MAACLTTAAVLVWTALGGEATPRPAIAAAPTAPSEKTAGPAAPATGTSAAPAPNADTGIRPTPTPPSAVPGAPTAKAGLFKPRGGLPNVTAKLHAGAPVKIAYFGGSITAANGWRPKSLAWFARTFPKAAVSEVNAAIGGTGSDLGAFRLRRDVLEHKPDLLFVEFAVNDGGGDPQRILRTMEGIVRQARRADAGMDVCFVYTLAKGYEKDLDAGWCHRAAAAHEAVADHYGVPSVNFGVRVAQLAREGKLVLQHKDTDGPAPAGKIIFTKDAVHPLDAGHDVYRDVLVEALGPVLSAPTRAEPHAMPAPLNADNWENALMVPLAEAAELGGGWRALDANDTLAKRFGNRFGTLHEATAPGATITLKFRGTAAFLYDLVGPDGGQVVVTVDGKESPAPRPRFDKYCTYHRIATLTLVEKAAPGPHTIVVRLHPDQPDRSIVTDIEKTKPKYDARKYDGTALRVGAVLLLGEVDRPAGK